MLKGAAAAFSPGHVTGIFYIPELPDDPLYRSSLGAGFSVHMGVKTEVNLEEGDGFKKTIYINGKKDDRAIVSERTTDLFFARTGITPKGKLVVRHHIELPQGSGFGTSGAGVLSLSLALNQLYDTGLSATEAAQPAHVAEVECKTGLGTVMGEVVGGMKLLVRRGGPGIGKIKQILYPENIRAVFLVFGPLSTPRALGNASIRESINRTGRILYRKLKAAPVLANFIKLSREFTDRAGLATERIAAVLHRLDKEALPGSMLFFGETVVSLVSEDEVDRVVRIYRDYVDYHDFTESPQIMICRIVQRGARVIEKV